MQPVTCDAVAEPWNGFDFSLPGASHGRLWFFTTYDVAAPSATIRILPIWATKIWIP
jgi:hypothetical protein